MSGAIGAGAVLIFALFVTGYFFQSRLPPPKPKILGIDLGTTFSCVSTYEFKTGNVTVYADEHGKRIIPSVVAILDDRILVGYDAVQQIETNSKNTIFDAKRFIGKTYSNGEINPLTKNYAFSVTTDESNRAVFSVKLKNGTRVFSPEDIGSFILRKLRKMAESKISRDMSMAVISVPADFSEEQRNATVEAGRRAGLKVLRVINEPTAAALAYGLHEKTGSNVIIVIDFGGGTLDVSLLYVHNGMFVTMAMAGNNRLGGQDINNNLINVFRERIHEKHNVDTSSPRDLQIIRDEVERVKQALTYAEEIAFRVKLDAVSPVTGQPVDYSYPLSREEFNKINERLFKRVLNPVKRVLRDAETEAGAVDEIVLVGGSTRIPKVRQLIQEFFNKVPNTSIDPDVAVTVGVAVQAGILGNGWPLKVAAIEIQNHKLKKVNLDSEIDEDDL